jgi:hypothetical protein
MSKHSTNRLDSHWPSDNGSDPAARVVHDELAEKLEPLVRNAAGAIAAYPRASLTIAATLGALLGWFIKRK